MKYTIYDKTKTRPAIHEIVETCCAVLSANSTISGRASDKLNTILLLCSKQAIRMRKKLPRFAWSVFWPRRLKQLKLKPQKTLLQNKYFSLK